MKLLFGFRHRRRTTPIVGFLLVSAAIATLLALPARVAASPDLTEGWTQVVKGGFTDPNNWYAPTWAEFRDHLYISTAAIESNSVFSGSDKSGGDIWRTADGVTWEQVGTAGLGDPHNILFQLVVFRGKLYAISNNPDGGIEIWVTSDGSQFAKIGSGGLGDENNQQAFPYVFQDRLILGVSNLETGAEIWVSEDGQSFRQVVDGGMGDGGVTGFTGFADPDHPDPVFQGRLYVGVANPGRGGEIWRTADGIIWERAADKGVTRSNTILLHPYLVYQDRLYAFGTAGGTLDNILGFDLFRTEDGTTWEQVVSDGFGVGKERNVSGDLEEFKGRLYLASNTMDPRLLIPNKPTERLAPRGFQLRVSDDGKTWTQVGEDGFGRSSSIMAGMHAIGDVLYLSSFDYHEGSRLWRSDDGEKWDVIFQEPEPDFFKDGGSPLEFKGHFLWVGNDRKRGLEIWRSDEVMVAEELATPTSGTPGAPTGGADTATAGALPSTGGSSDSTGGSSDSVGGSSVSADGSETSESAAGHETTGREAGGLSGGWIALIAVLGALVVVAFSVVAFLVGRLTRAPGGASGTMFCKACGKPLSPGARFCANCGSQV